MNGKRPWIAAAFALVYPGLGHAYLRAWVRALVWAGFAVATAALVVPESAVAAFQNGGFQGLVEASRSFGPAVYGPILVVRGMNVVDAFMLGVQQNRAGGPDADACPECGRELDDELDFCPWCTARLEDGEEEPEPAP